MPSLLILLALTLACRAPPCQPPPPLSDLDRFPDHRFANDAYHYADRHVWEMLARHALEPHHHYYLDDWLTEARFCRGCWDRLDTATNVLLDAGDRVYALGELRRQLGPAAYGVGWMPPPVPWWRFRTLD